jgi:hypothetical protein
MAYTRAWSDSNIPGSTQANQIDEEFRASKVDIHERMNELVVDWTADPVVPLAALKGALLNKILVIPHTSFWATTQTGLVLTTQYISVQFVTGPLLAGFTLPVNVTLKQLDILCDLRAAVPVDYTIYKTAYTNPPDLSILDSGQIITVGLQVFQSGVISPTEIVSGNEIYYISFDQGGTGAVESFRLYGVRAIYDCPDSTATI